MPVLWYIIALILKNYHVFELILVAYKQPPKFHELKRFLFQFKQWLSPIFTQNPNQKNK